MVVPEIILRLVTDEHVKWQAYTQKLSSKT